MAHRSIQIVSLLALLVLGSFDAALGGEREFTGAAREYLDQMLQANIPLMYAECLQRDGKSVLILPISTGLSKPPLTPFSNGLPREDFRNSALLIQDLMDSRVINTANVYFDGKGRDIKMHLLLDTGGEQTYQVSNTLMQELLRSDFHFVFPPTIQAIVDSKPTRECQTKY